MSSIGEAWILSALRTPLGSMNGALAEVPASKLGAICIQAAIQQAGVLGENVDEVFMGNVIGAGLGQNPARQASIGAGLPVSVGATTVNKVCGSGLKALMLADQAIRAGDATLVVAGGMENMSQAPYLLTKARQGYRLGHGELIDSMIQDGLWDVYGQASMGVYGDRCAEAYQLTREAQDDFAVRSHNRARMATDLEIFAKEIVPVEVTIKGQTRTIEMDEGPSRFNEEKLRKLRPAFHPEGTITAGNASSINDGSAALVVASDRYCQEKGLKPRARIVGSATFSREPEWFTIAPIGAIERLLNKLAVNVDDIDLFEINEAFAAVTMAAMQKLRIPVEKVNIHGGAVALGHPIGCSGARIVVTLLNALQHNGLRRGIACLCVGGGEAVALALETIL